MRKISIHFVFVAAFAVSTLHANASTQEIDLSTREEAVAELVDSGTLVYYGASTVSSFLVFRFLNSQYGVLSFAVLKAMAGTAFVGSGARELVSSFHSTKSFASKEREGVKTYGQLKDESNFVERFGYGEPVVCESSTIGAIWNGFHSVLELQILGEGAYDAGGVCRRYFLETTTGSKGILLTEEASGTKLQFSISNDQVIAIQKWLVDFDRKNLDWSSIDNDCVDFIFKVFKAVGHEADILAWLGSWQTGLTSSKAHLLKYLLTETFRMPRNDQPCVFVQDDSQSASIDLVFNIFADLYINPGFMALVLPSDLVRKFRKTRSSFEKTSLDDGEKAGCRQNDC